MSPTLKVHLQAFQQFRGLVLRLFLFSLVLSLVDLGGVLSISAAITLLQQPEIPFQNQIFSRFHLHIPTLSFDIVIIAIVIFQVGLAHLKWQQSNVTNHLRMELMTWWNQQFLKTVYQSSWLVVSQYKATQLAHIVSFEISRMGDAFFLALRMLSHSILCVGYLLFILLGFNPQVIAVLLLLTLGLALIKFMIPNTRATGEALSEQSEQLDRQLVHHLQGFKSLALGGQAHVGALQAQIYSLEKSWFRAHTVLTQGHFIQNVLSLCMGATGLWYIHHYAKLNLELLALLAYIYYRINPVAQHLIQDLQEWQQLSPSFSRTLSVLQQLRNDPLMQGAKQLAQVQQLSVRNLSFRYSPHSPAGLNQINFQAQRGELLLIKGPNGKGKSTLADLLARILNVQEGQILVDGENSANFTLSSWGKQVAYLPQEVFLVRGSLGQNLAWPEDNSEPLCGEFEVERIKAAKTKLANHPLRHWIFDRFSNLDEELHENDARLSGGTQKKIALLRTLLRESSIIILDEPTEHLDAKSRVEFVEALKMQKPQAIWIIMSHDPICQALADRMVEL